MKRSLISVWKSPLGHFFRLSLLPSMYLLMPPWVIVNRPEPGPYSRHWFSFSWSIVVMCICSLPLPVYPGTSETRHWLPLTAWKTSGIMHTVIWGKGTLWPWAESEQVPPAHPIIAKIAQALEKGLHRIVKNYKDCRREITANKSDTTANQW